MELSERISHLDVITRRAFDIILLRSARRKEVHIIWNVLKKDHYQDTFNREFGRTKKWAYLYRSGDLNYVQELEDELYIDTEELPWFVIMSRTGLKRTPRRDDFILIDGQKYAIAAVQPRKKLAKEILKILIYPERTKYEDELKIHKIKYLFAEGEYKSYKDLCGNELIIDFTYGGNPLEVSIGDKYFPFKSRIKFYPENEDEIYTLKIKDKNKEVYKTLK